MRSPKRFVSVLTSCVLIGFSSSAMAEGCGDGVLQGERFDGTLRVSDERSCTIIGSTIGGDIRITNVANVVLINNRVNGEVQINGNAKIGTANLIENTVFGGKLVVRDYDTANVIGNETLNNKLGNIEVISNIRAFVQQNISARNLICENTDTDASYNIAAKQKKCD